MFSSESKIQYYIFAKSIHFVLIKLKLCDLFVSSRINFKVNVFLANKVKLLGTGYGMDNEGNFYIGTVECIRGCNDVSCSKY